MSKEMSKDMQKGFPEDNNKRKKPGLKSIDMITAKRLMSYLKKHKLKLILVILCIALSALASAGSSLFLGKLIDDYISPYQGNSVYGCYIYGRGCVRTFVQQAYGSRIPKRFKGNKR